MIDRDTMCFYTEYSMPLAEFGIFLLFDSDIPKGSGTRLMLELLELGAHLPNNVVLQPFKI